MLFIYIYNMLNYIPLDLQMQWFYYLVKDWVGCTKRLELCLFYNPPPKKPQTKNKQTPRCLVCLQVLMAVFARDCKDLISFIKCLLICGWTSFSSWLFLNANGDFHFSLDDTRRWDRQKIVLRHCDGIKWQIYHLAELDPKTCFKKHGCLVQKLMFYWRKLCHCHTQLF